MTTGRTSLLAAVAAGCVVAANAHAVPTARAAPPGSGLQWYRWHPSMRSLHGGRRALGSRAVIGVSTMHDLDALRRSYGFGVVRAFPRLHAAIVRVSPSLRARAAGDRRIRYLSPLGAAQRFTAMPNDPLVSTRDPATGLPYEWQFASSGVDRALELSPGSPSVLVGTIDSGAADIPDLAGKVDQRWSVTAAGKVTRDAKASDLLGHGTAVAALIAANVDDGFGMAGFGGASHLIAVRVWTLTPVATAVALMKLDALGVRIVNMSFAGDLPEKPIMRDAIHRAEADGMLLVAAAGNSAHGVSHPAADLQPPGGSQSYGLAVGASDADGRVASFSNSGEHLSLLAPGASDVACPGVLTAVEWPIPDVSDACYPTVAGADGARYVYVAGTSFAAPEVAGVAALVWAARPALTNYEVADIIKASARRSAGWTPRAGCGVLDAAAALELATGLSSRAGDTGSMDACGFRSCGGGASCSAASRSPTSRARRSSSGSPRSCRFSLRPRSRPSSSSRDFADRRAPSRPTAGRRSATSPSSAGRAGRSRFASATVCWCSGRASSARPRSWSGSSHTPTS